MLKLVEKWIPSIKLGMTVVSWTSVPFRSEATLELELRAGNVAEALQGIRAQREAEARTVLVGRACPITADSPRWTRTESAG